MTTPGPSSSSSMADALAGFKLGSYLYVDLGYGGPIEKIAADPEIPGKLWVRNFGMAEGIGSSVTLDSIHVVELKNRRPLAVDHSIPHVVPEPYVELLAENRPVALQLGQLQAYRGPDGNPPPSHLDADYTKIRRAEAKLVVETDEEATDPNVIRRFGRPLKPIGLTPGLCLLTTFSSVRFCMFDPSEIEKWGAFVQQGQVVLGPYQQRADGRAQSSSGGLGRGVYLDSFLGEEWYLSAMLVGATGRHRKGGGDDQSSSWRSLEVALAYTGFTVLVRAREEPDRFGFDILERLDKGPQPRAEDSGLKEFEVRVWRVDGGQATAIEMSADGRTLFVGLTTGELLAHSVGSTFQETYRHRLLLMTRSPRLCLVDPACPAEVVREFVGHVPEEEDCDSMGYDTTPESPFAASIGRRLFALCGADKAIRIWSLNSSEPLVKPDSPPGDATAHASTLGCPPTLKGFFTIKPRSIAFTNWEPATATHPGQPPTDVSQQRPAPFMLAVATSVRNLVVFYH